MRAAGATQTEALEEKRRRIPNDSELVRWDIDTVGDAVLVTAVLHKLQFSNRYEMTRWAVDRHLIQPGRLLRRQVSRRTSKVFLKSHQRPESGVDVTLGRECLGNVRCQQHHVGALRVALGVLPTSRSSEVVLVEQIGVRVRRSHVAPASWRALH